jgi:hypothetical protein
MKDFAKKYWKYAIALILAALAGGGVVKVTTAPVDHFEIIIPEDATEIFSDGGPLILMNGSKEGATFAALQAMRMSGNELKKRGGEREKLFAVLKAIHNNPAILSRAQDAARTAVAVDPATVAILVKIAIAVAVKALEKIAPTTPNTFDDRLLALLKLFERNPAAIDAAYNACPS